MPMPRATPRLMKTGRGLARMDADFCPYPRSSVFIRGWFSGQMPMQRLAPRRMKT